MTERRHVGPRSADGIAAREGRHLGPVRITVTRIVLVVAVLGSIAYLAYAITVRDDTQIPMLASGAAVLGLVFGALAIAGAVETTRSARADRPGRSVVVAILGGIAGIIAFGCFAVAVVLAILWSAS